MASSMRNFALKLVGETGVRFFSSIFVFLLAHQLGADQFGVYSTAFAFASIFVIIVDLGMSSVVTRDIARDPEARPKVLGSSGVIKVVAAFVALAAIDLLGHFSEFARQHRSIVDGLGVVVVSYTLIDYMAALVTGKEEMGWEATLKVVCRGSIAIAGAAALFLTHSLADVVTAMVAASIVSLVVGAAIVGTRFGGFHWRPDAQVAKRLMTSSLPLLGSVVFWIFYDNQDILLLHHFVTPARDIGLFWSASKMIDVLKVFPVLLTGAFFPRLARFTHARESFLETTRSLMGYALLFMPFLLVAVYVTAARTERLFYGPEFVAAAPLLKRLLWAYIPISFNHICMQILITRDREKKLLGGAMLACITNFALTWYFIPISGTLGVCNALVISETIYLLFQLNLVLDAVPGLFNPRRRTFG